MPDSRIKLRYRVRGQTYMMTADQLDDFSAKQDFKEPAYLDSITADGGTFTTARPVTLGTILEIRIEVPDGGNAIRGMARVLQAKQAEDEENCTVEVSFLNISPDNQARILACIEKPSE